MQNLKTLNQARRIAQELLAQSKENEPQITADLQIIAQEVSVEIVGSEHKFKSEESLIRKLINIAEVDSVELERVSRKINDALRYTFIFPFETYATDFHQTIGKLRDRDYHIPENKIWNAWQTIGKRFDKGYRGIKYDGDFFSTASF